jgi:AcrR family transcriptional regulator
MGIKERKAREKRARRELILRSAQKVFLTKGFEQTTIEDIAAEAELSKGALYLYFKSKEELYMAVFRKGLERLYEQMDALRADFGKVEAERLLRRLMEVYYNFFHRNPEFVYTTSQVYHGRIQEKVAEETWVAVVNLGKDCLEVLVETITQGVQDGTFRKVDCRKTANCLWAATTGVMIMAEDEPGPRVIDFSQRELLDQTFELFFYSLRK